MSSFGRGGGGPRRDGPFNRRGELRAASMPPSAALPADMLPYFAPRAPLEYLPPVQPVLPAGSKGPGIAGVGDLVSQFESGPPPPRHHDETPAQAKARRAAEKAAAHAIALKEAVAAYRPPSGESLTSESYHTLFISRLAYETTESRLRRECEEFGRVLNVRIIKDQEGSPRGYAFVEFASEDDMKRALRMLNGQKIEGRRVIVDVERGRTVPGWLPRYLGGGRGESRKAVPPRPKKKDSWIRPWQVAYWQISMDTKAASASAAAEAQAQAMEAGRKAVAEQPSVSTGHGGYSVRVHMEQLRAARELAKAMATANAESIAAAAAADAVAAVAAANAAEGSAPAAEPAAAAHVDGTAGTFAVDAAMAAAAAPPAASSMASDVLAAASAALLSAPPVRARSRSPVRERLANGQDARHMPGTDPSDAPLPPTAASLPPAPAVEDLPDAPPGMEDADAGM